MKLDNRLAEALLQLTPHPVFQDFVKAIREDANEALRACAATDGTQLFRAQGKYQGLASVLEAIDGARGYFDKVTKQR